MMSIFLFTDIEGSTERWLKHKDVMGEVLARHDGIVKGAIERYGGRVIKHTGDGFFAVFEGGDPLACALDIQRGLEAEGWGEIGELRVRVVLHAGEAEQRGGDYFGSVVIRGFRMLAAAWGGQILLTPEVRDHCSLPEGASLLDLGVHQLKDLGEPQLIYQLNHPDLILREFPSLRTLSARPHNLPPQPTPFIGREQEIGELTEILKSPSCRLLTLIGPGGIGKTRLALQVAAEVIEGYQHGVYFIPLAQLTLASPQFLVFTIAEGLRFSFYSREDPKVQLMNYLREKEMLLVMDNFEHVIEAVDLLSEILGGASKIKILVTSRERLNLKEEWLFELGGMSYPEDGEEQVEGYSAIQLFLQHAKRLSPGITLKESDKASVVDICRLVSGMPLGIELAASWVRTLDLKNIKYEIERSLDFLRSSLRDIPERHRSLRAVFEYSWNLLTEKEKEIFRRLSVFRGGIDRTAGEKVSGASIDLLTALVDKTLLRRVSPNRFEMLDLLRVFAEEKLNQDQEEKKKVCDCHCQYFAEFLKMREKDLVGLKQREALDEIGKEIENIRACWNWAIMNEKTAEIDKSIEGLFSFYEMRGWLKEGEEAFRKAEDRLRRKGEMFLFGRVLEREAMFCYRQAHYEEAEVMVKRSLKIFKEHGKKKELARAYINLGNIGYRLGRVDEAEKLYQEGLRTSTGIDDQFGVAIALNALGVVIRVLGDLSKAKDALRKSIEISREIGYQRGIALSFNNLGNIAVAEGDYSEARKLYQECLVIFEEISDICGIGLSNNNIGYAMQKMGEFNQAKKALEESLRIYKQIGDQRGQVLAMLNLGYVAIEQGDKLAGGFLKEALKIAHKIHARPLLLEAMVGMAQFLTNEGREKVACAILLTILKYEIKDKEVNARAKRMFAELESRLPNTVVEELKAKSEVLSDLVQRIIEGRFED